MIYRIIYIGEKHIKEKDQIKKIPIPSPLILQHQGPVLEVEILPPKIIRDKLQQQGLKIPSVKVKALIDTGAYTSVILPRIATQVNLIHTGYQQVISVQNQQKQPAYFGAIAFSWGKIKETKLVACPIKGYDCLIGRDVLIHWYLNYDGGGGSIVICD